MEEAEIVELYELCYSDLLLLSSSTSPDELHKVEAMTKTIMETLGPLGPGLLAVTGVPGASQLRNKFLPLARELALLDHETRKRILKEHSLGSDVPLKNPDRSVSSFAMQLKYANATGLTEGKPNRGADYELHAEDKHQEVDQMMLECHDMKFKNVGSIFKELGFCMMQLGLRLARICDRAIGSNELEQSLLESCAAKGRLIHYHSVLDGLLLKELARPKRTCKSAANSKKDKKYINTNSQKQLDSSAYDASSCGIHSNLWQQWHYDYGIFTVLTAPFFLMPSCSLTAKTEEPFSASCCEEFPSPMGHTCLQIYDPNKKKVFMVKAPPESFIIQVGESADIISKGKLRSTLHSVYRPAKFENLSRETFVVFLQPSWNKTFSITHYTQTNMMSNDRCLMASDDESKFGQDKSKLCDEIQRIVPPLSSRLKDGMTFAEFSRETTKQYYGGSGLQSNR